LKAIELYLSKVHSLGGRDGSVQNPQQVKQKVNSKTRPTWFVNQIQELDKSGESGCTTAFKGSSKSVSNRVEGVVVHPLRISFQLTIFN